MSSIPESELFINERGAIYHLNLRPDEIAPLIITVGDPGRVVEVSKHFDRIESKNQHREFITHTGLIGQKRISVLSTGIGPDNIDIVLNELDALVNIDFDTRKIKDLFTPLNIVRIGTAGSLQADIPAGSFVVSTHGLGIDNLMNFYRTDSNEEEKELLQSFLTQTQVHSHISYPYINHAAPSLLKHFVNGFHQGITITCPGFYGPQGRMLRLPLAQPDLIDKFAAFRFGPHRICNFEMETAAIYGLGKALGHHCLSLSAIIANRISHKFAENPSATISNLIQKALETIVNL